MHYVRSGLEGVVDVGIIVMAHFENPAQEYASEFLRDALTWRRYVIIPLSTYLGAYVIMTKYLKLKRNKVSRALLETLLLPSPAFYGNLPKVVIEKAITTASTLDISSWDGYLIELAKELQIGTVYSLDKKLADRIKEVKVINPIPKEAIEEYYNFLEKKLK